MKLVSAFAIVIVLIFFPACSKPPQPPQPPAPDSTKPVITSISPSHGTYLTIDTINGSGFNTISSLDSIYFNGVKAIVISASPTQLIVTVPSKAGTGNVSLNTNGFSVTGPVFTYDNFTVSVFAGNGYLSSIDATGTLAGFGSPTGIAADSSGNIYVADLGNYTIRKITSSAVVTTFAGVVGKQGLVNGTGTSAKFDYPYGVCTDASGNVYVADANESKIRKITPSGVVTSYTADIVGGSLVGVAVDAGGNMYIAAPDAISIRKISPSGIITSIAVPSGDPWGITTDASGNAIIADAASHTIYKISAGGNVSGIAGIAGTAGATDGPAAVATFNKPRGVAIDKAGTIYVADQGNNSIRKISAAGVVSTLMSGISRYAQNGGGFFTGPFGLCVDSKGILYVINTGESTILKIKFD